MNLRDLQNFDKRMKKLAAYEATGLTPEGVQMMADWVADKCDPAPAPLPLYEEEFSLGAGLLEDDGHDPALLAQERYQQERWDK